MPEKNVGMQAKKYVRIAGTMPERMSDRMLEYMPDTLPSDKWETMSE